MGRAGIFFLAIVVSACGGAGPSAPTAPANPTPPPIPPIGATRARLTSALNSEQAISGATIDAESIGTATSDAQGYFTLQASSAAPYRIRVSGDGWIERTTMLKVPGDEATVSLIPTSLNATYFNEMCRGFVGRLARWHTAPALVVETAVITYGNRLATSETVPAALVERTMGELWQALPVLTAGRFADFASIEVRRTPEGQASQTIAGAVALTWQRDLLNRFTHVAYGGRATGGPDGGLGRGEVALDYEWHALGLPAGSRRDFFYVVQHEFGHALGYSHTKTAPSFMYETYLLTVSALDRQAFEIYMQRPSGNQYPDIDPTGTSVNLEGITGEMHIPRCPSVAAR